MKIGRSIVTSIAAHAAAVDPHGDRAYSDAELAAAIAPLAHKELYVPWTYGNDLSGIGAKISEAGLEGSVAILIPQDFTAITALELILLPRETGANMHINITTEYGAYNGGEAYNVHSEADTARDIGATVAWENMAHSISDLVDAVPLAAGDLLMVSLTFNATAIDTHLDVRGIRLSYS